MPPTAQSSTGMYDGVSLFRPLRVAHRSSERPAPNALSPVCDTLGLERDRAIMGLWLAQIGTAERAQVHCGRTIIFMPCVAAPSAL